MRTTAILILSLLAGGCAATSGSAPTAAGSLRMLEPVDARGLELVAAAEPAPQPDPLAPLSTSIQDTGSASAEPASPHSFNAGIGLRFRGGESALDLAAEYHYRVSDTLDVGGIADWAWSPINSLLVAPAAWLHPSDRLTLFAAPGVEFLSGRGGKGALRVGGSYLIPLGKVGIRPFGWYDFVVDRKDSLSLGIAIGV